MTLASGEDHPGSVAVNPLGVFWADLMGPIRMLATSATSPTTIANGTYPQDIAADANNIYWADYGTSAIMKMKVPGGTPVTLASDQAAPYAITVDDVNVYWTAWGAGGSCYTNDGFVASVPTTGGEVSTLATGQMCALDITVDDTSVYWTQRGGASSIGLPGGAVMKVTPK